MNTMQHELLFTELTSEQAEVIEGGATVTLANLNTSFQFRTMHI